MADTTSGGNNRFYVQLQTGKTAEETANRTFQALTQLVAQLNAAKIPVVVGAQDDLPEGMLAGQPIINWQSGTPTLQIFDGNQIVS